jgi:hypothetical protein
VSDPLQNAADFRELLRDDVADGPYVYREIFSDTGWRQRALSKKRLRLLKRIDPVLRSILWENERVLFVTHGVMARFLEWYFLGWALYYLARRAIIVTDRRIVLLQIGMRGKPGELVSQIDEPAIADVRSTITGYMTVEFRNGAKVLFAAVPRPARKRLAELTAQLSGEPTPMKSLSGEVQHLCPHCFARVSGLPAGCTECGGAFKSATKAGLLSLIFPGAGDLYLGHRGFAAVELVIASTTWIGLITLARNPTVGVIAYVFIAAFTVLVVHGFDALATRYIARKGLHPDWPGPRGDWWHFAAAVTIPALALFWAGSHLAKKTALAPGDEVVVGSAVPAAHRAAIVDAGIVDAEEEILLFYSNGPASILAHGSLLTDRRALSYVYDGQTMQLFTARYDEIMDATAHFSGMAEVLSAIIVARSDGDGVVLLVPSAGAQDRAFMDTLTARWRRAREASPTEGFWFVGGSGDSANDPVVLLGDGNGSPTGWAETIWISMRHGEQDIHWQMDSQIRHVRNGRTIDEVTVVSLDGEVLTTFFDVTEAIARPSVR